MYIFICIIIIFKNRYPKSKFMNEFCILLPTLFSLGFLAKGTLPPQCGTAPWRESPNIWNFSSISGSFMRSVDSFFDSFISMCLYSSCSYIFEILNLYCFKIPSSILFLILWTRKMKVRPKRVAVGVTIRARIWKWTSRNLPVNSERGLFRWITTR